MEITFLRPLTKVVGANETWNPCWLRRARLSYTQSCDFLSFFFFFFFFLRRFKTNNSSGVR